MQSTCKRSPLCKGLAPLASNAMLFMWHKNKVCTKKEGFERRDSTRPARCAQQSTVEDAVVPRSQTQDSGCCSPAKSLGGKRILKVRLIKTVREARGAGSNRCLIAPKGEYLFS